MQFFDGITKVDFNFVWTLMIMALVIFWIVVLYWVWLDSGDRVSSISARIGYVLLPLFLFVPGLIIYLLIRPPQTIEEIYWADLERRYLKYETSELGDCPKCGTQLFPGFTYCPNCRLVLKVKCPNCEVEMDKHYKYCPSCGETINKSDTPVVEEVPSREVMEEQIQASKEEAVETVKAKRVRYSESGGVAVRVGAGVISFFSSLFGKDEKEVEEEEKRDEEVSESNVRKEKKDLKREKKRKR